jgi:hypothetical protein
MSFENIEDQESQPISWREKITQTINNPNNAKIGKALFNSALVGLLSVGVTSTVLNTTASPAEARPTNSIGRRMQRNTNNVNAIIKFIEFSIQHPKIAAGVGIGIGVATLGISAAMLNACYVRDENGEVVRDENGNPVVDEVALNDMQDLLEIAQRSNENMQNPLLMYEDHRMGNGAFGEKYDSSKPPTKNRI